MSTASASRARAREARRSASDVRLGRAARGLWLLPLLLPLLLLLPRLASADDSADAVGFGDTEDASDAVGFGGEPTAAAPSPPAAPAPARTDPFAGTLEASGSLGQRTALWTRRLGDHPLAQIKQSADLALRYRKPLGLGAEAPQLRLVAQAHIEQDLAYLQEHLQTDEATQDAYAAQLIGRETFVALSWGAVDVAFGRQIVAWGQGEVLSPVDVVNPRDLREPGLAELDDLRMAVLASRAGLSFGAHRVEALVVHESFFGLRPAPLSDFSPIAGLLTADPQAAALLEGKQLRFVDLPGRFTEDAGQLYAHWGYAGESLDLSLYAASTLDKQGVPQMPAPSELSGNRLSLRLWHPRYTMLGHAGDKPLGAFVLRWEANVELDRPLAVQRGDGAALALDYVRRDQANLLLAATYFGIEDSTFALEYAQSLLLDSEALPAGMRQTFRGQLPTFALRVMRSFARETLTLHVVALLLGVAPHLGSFARFELDYELLAALHAGVGYAFYRPSSHEVGPLYGFTHHDRVYASLRWDFALE